MKPFFLVSWPWQVVASIPKLCRPKKAQSAYRGQCGDWHCDCYFCPRAHSLGQVCVPNKLLKRATFVPPFCMRYVWLCRDLEWFNKRLARLERHVSQTREVRTEAQEVALERQLDDDVIRSEIDTAHPVYLGSQNTYDVGTINGSGCIDQQISIDTYPKWAAAKLCTIRRRLQHRTYSTTDYHYSLPNRAWR